MELKAFVDRIRDLVTDADLEKALRELIQYMRDHEDYAKLEDMARTNLASYNRAEHDRQSSIISTEDYEFTINTVTHNVLKIASDLEHKGPIARKHVSTAAPAIHTPPAQRTQENIFISIILAVLVLSIAGFFYFLIVENIEIGAAFFTSAAGTCFIYLNNKKQNQQALLDIS